MNLRITLISMNDILGETALIEAGSIVNRYIISNKGWDIDLPRFIKNSE